MERFHDPLWWAFMGWVLAAGAREVVSAMVARWRGMPPVLYAVERDGEVLAVVQDQRLAFEQALIHGGHVLAYDARACRIS